MFGGIQKKNNRRPIGIALGGRSITMVQLERNADGYSAIDALRSALPDDLPINGPEYHTVVAKEILQMLNQSSFAGREVVSCLPPAGIHYKNLRMPKMPADEMAAAVQWEADERRPFGSEDVTTQHLHVGEVRQGDETRQEVIMMASPVSFIESHIKMLSGCGLRPTALDVAPAALARCLAGRVNGADPAPDETRVIVDIGETCSQVLIVRGGRLVFLKTIDISGVIFNQAVADKLKTTGVEAEELRRRPPSDDSGPDNILRAVFEALRPVVGDLARELGLCLRYYGVTFRGPRPEQAMFVGEESDGPWYNAEFSETAGIDVHAVDPLSLVDLSKIAHPPSDAVPRGAWATAMGLSMRHEPNRLRKAAAA